MDDLLRKFWEVEEAHLKPNPLSPEEMDVMSHFHRNYRQDGTGRFMVPLPKRPGAQLLGNLAHKLSGDFCL